MHIEPLPYQTRSINIFNRFAHLPYAMFLDSCYDIGACEHFDILVADPCWTITSNQQNIVLHTNDEKFTLNETLFTALKKHLDQKKMDTSQIPQRLPFVTGLLGFIGYDNGYPLNTLTCRTHCDITLPDAALGYYDWCIIVDHQQQESFLISQHSPDSPRFQAISQLITQPTPRHPPFKLEQPFSANLSQDDYLQAFARIKQHIQAGDCYQVNFAQRFQTRYQGSPWKAYQAWRQKSPAPLAAFINLPEGAILSLSPERFLQVQREQVMTRPIKGTRPRYKDAQQDQLSAAQLIDSVKDRAENVMIVDLLRNDLSKNCIPGSVNVPNLCVLESFSNVHHLVSTISGQLLPERHPFDLFKDCFPGGSITGTPKRRAMEIIDTLEPHHRGVYCGSIVYCDIRNKMDSNIAIRTLQCTKEHIYCHGGGGIVSDSQAEAEYQESLIKIANLVFV